MVRSIITGVKTGILLTIAVLLLSGAFYVAETTYYAETGPDHVVMDCFFTGQPCQNTTIHRTITDCLPLHRPTLIMIFVGPACEYTLDGLNEVSMLTDPMNHVRGPHTTISYNTTYTPELDQPWDLAFLPDGSAVITEQGGDILQYRNNTVRRIGRLRVTTGELFGLMGVAVHPDYAENHYLYLYYTSSFDAAENQADGAPVKRFLTGQISRFKLSDGILHNKTVIVNDLPASRWRAGGRIEFGPDGKLYATTGDASHPETAQNADTLNGKILRLNPDGTIPSDNPFPGSYVYSRGHRNPQGLSWQPATGDLYITEHGPIRHDEINLILPGANYGWGARACDTVQDPRIALETPMQQPIRCFTNWTIAPSGATFIDDPGSPLDGDLFVAGLRGKHLRRFMFDGGQITGEELFFVEDGTETNLSRRLRDVEYHDGSLWILGDERGMVRLQLE